MNIIGKAKHLVVTVARSTKKLALAAVGAGAAVLSSLAAPTKAHAVGLTVPAIDLTDFYTAVGVLLTALVAIWVAYRVIAFFKK